MPSNVSASVYRERVFPSLGFLSGLLVMPVALFLIALPFGENVAIAVTAASLITIVLLVFLTAPLISVQNGYLRVSKATIELTYLGEAIAVPKQDAFSERGPKLAPSAFTRFQPGVKELLKVKIVDERDPVPYWIFSTRNPEILAAILNKR